MNSWCSFPMTEPTNAHWYALRSQAHRERHLWHYLKSVGHEAYYPVIHVQPVNPRARKVRPFFPGYLFVKSSLDEVGASTFNHMPYAIGLVCYGTEPIPIQEHVIQGIMRRIADLLQSRRDHLSKFSPGDPVRIKSGLLEGYDAIFDTRISGSTRVRLLLDLLSGAQIRLQIDGNQIAKA